MRRPSRMDSKFDAMRKVLAPHGPNSGARITRRHAKLARKSGRDIAETSRQSAVATFPDRCLLRDLQCRSQRIGHKSVHVPLTTRAMIQMRACFEIAYTHNVRSK